MLKISDRVNQLSRRNSLFSHGTVQAIPLQQYQSPTGSWFRRLATAGRMDIDLDQ
jgi:hypothetical protein